MLGSAGALMDLIQPYFVNILAVFCMGAYTELCGRCIFKSISTPGQDRARTAQEANTRSKHRNTETGIVRRRVTRNMRGRMRQDSTFLGTNMENATATTEIYTKQT